MSLNWDVSNVVNHEVVTTHPDDRSKPEGEDKRWHPTTESLVWLAMICGFTRITEKNWQDCFHRIRFYERATGPMRASVNGPIYITAKDVFAHIGLATNCSSKAQANFLKHAFEVAKMDSVAEINNFLTGKVEEV